MAQSSWPSPAASRVVNDIQYEQMTATQHVDGLVGDPTDTDLVYADGTSGLTVHLRAGRYAQLRGHGWTSGVTDVALTIGSNSSGSTRIDLVVLGLNRSTWDVSAYVVAGTPGSGAPALTVNTGTSGTYEIPLAEVTVATGASAISAGQVKIRHWWIRPDGAASRGADTRPVNVPVGYKCVENGDTLALVTGGTWTNLTSPPTPVNSAQTTDFGGSSQINADSTWRDIPSSKWAPLTFTVPPSGRVFVTLSAFVQNQNTSTSTLWATWRASGGGFTTGTDDVTMQKRGISCLGGRMSGSNRQPFTGLTPGTSVTLTPVYSGSSANSNAQTTFIHYGNLIMEPA